MHADWHRQKQTGTARGEGESHLGECTRQSPGCLSRSDGEGTKCRHSFLFHAFVEHPRAGTAHSTEHTPYRTAGSLSSVEGENSAGPSLQRNRTSNLNETTSAHLCQGGNWALKRPANRSQINKGNRFRRDRFNRLKSL